jgi:hypothetical protein
MSMREQLALIAMMLGLACGGESTRDGSSGAAAGSSANGGGAAGAGAQTGSYLPEDANVPAVGDGRLEGGSFEGNLGFGWDFCFSKYPGVTATLGLDSASDGEIWLAFDSQKSCSGSLACRADGGDIQVGFWLGTPLPAGEPLHLYFDAINLGQANPSGVLHVDVMDTTANGCMSAAALATLPLHDLELTSNWSTRCVSFTPNAALDKFGLYVTGETFQLGLDAFRFGPPCRTF